MSGRSVRDQAERISRCRLTFHLHGAAGKTGLINQAIVDRALFIEEPSDQRQGRLSLETAKLSEGFFEQLKKHPVPLEEAAVRAICNNPAALGRLPVVGLPPACAHRRQTGHLGGSKGPIRQPQRAVPLQEPLAAGAWS